MWIVEAPILCRWLGIGGIALGVIVLVNDKHNVRLVRHEMIDIAQWRELWYIGFLPWYLWEWCLKGYRENRFEREAYANDHDPHYLDKRKRFSFLLY